jgi:hypothetical protein
VIFGAVAAAGLIALSLVLLFRWLSDSPTAFTRADELPGLNGDDLGDWPAPARTLAELVASSDLIVQAKVASVEYVGEIFPDNWDEVRAEAIAGGQPAEHWASGGASVTHVALVVTSYVVGSPDEIATIDGDTVLLQYLGDLTKTGGVPEGARRLFEGEEALLFLGWNGHSAVDGRPTYGVVDRALGVFMRGDDGRLTYADGDETLVPYVAGASFDEVLDEIRELAQR